MNQFTNIQNPSENVDAITFKLKEAFELQRNTYLSAGIPSLDERKQDLRNLKRFVNEHAELIKEAISKDYGNRAHNETILADIMPSTDSLNGAIKNVRKWSKVQKRAIDLTMYAGGKNRVIPQPLGVVGIIVPWNFPLMLSFVPLAAALAAGNRAMVKMSENSPTLTKLLIDKMPDYLGPEKLVFFEESGGVGVEFSKLPFDLLVFTGSGQTGRSVMASAAANLTPVILELGGKAPAVVAPDYPIKKAAQSIMYAKQLNAGQVCLNVDYVFVHESQRDEFVQHAKVYAKQYVPNIESDDYTSIIDDRSYQRLIDTVEDARSKGATVINTGGTQEANAESRKIPVHLILDTTPDMIIRNRESFGPLLMVLTYKESNEVLEYINAHDRPLAFYPFSKDKKLVQFYIDRTMSGGVTVNDALFHGTQHDLPFGGVGASGMGHYHGYDGFLSFSKLRPVFYQAPLTAMPMLSPPYGKFAEKAFGLIQKLKS